MNIQSFYIKAVRDLHSSSYFEKSIVLIGRFAAINFTSKSISQKTLYFKIDFSFHFFVLLIKLIIRKFNSHKVNLVINQNIKGIFIKLTPATANVLSKPAENFQLPLQQIHKFNEYTPFGEVITSLLVNYNPYEVDYLKRLYPDSKIYSISESQYSFHENLMTPHLINMIIQKNKSSTIEVQINEKDEYMLNLYLAVYYYGYSSFIDHKENKLLNYLKTDSPSDLEFLMDYYQIEKIVSKFNASGYRISFETLDGIVSNFNSLVNNYCSEKNSKVKEIALTALVIKRGFFINNSIQDIINLLSQNDYEIIHHENLEGTTYNNFLNNIRGGIWKIDGDKRLLPNHILILINKGKHVVSMNNLRFSNNPSQRFKHKILRPKFGCDGVYIHMTDKTSHVYDYLDCLDEPLKKKIFTISKNQANLKLLTNFRNLISAISILKVILIKRIRTNLRNYLLG